MGSSNPLKSFSYALHGIRYVFKHERNFRLHLLAGFFVLIAAFWFGLSRTDWIILIFLIMGILVLELLNSAFEKYIDILKPRLHSQVRTVKDILAGMVLVASLSAVIIGVLIFFPYIIEAMQ